MWSWLQELKRRFRAMAWHDGWVNPIPRLRLTTGEIVTPRVSSGYGEPRDGGARIHRGVDLMYRRPQSGKANHPEYTRWYWMPSRVIPVYAVGPGKVSSAGAQPSGKIRVTIDHGDVAGFGPLATFTTHLERAIVEKGEQVRAGDIIGIVGKTGTDINHPHHEWWFTARGKTYPEWTVDPAPFLRALGWLTVRSNEGGGVGGTWAPTGGRSPGLGSPPPYPSASGRSYGDDVIELESVPWYELDGSDEPEGVENPLGAIIQTAILGVSV